jgi:RloB-like protein
MGRDNQPKHRQKLRDISRRAAKKQPYESILIVTEGLTEANYLNEIRTQCRLSSTNIVALPSATGTEPTQIVEYALQLFLNGSSEKGIIPLVFDSVYILFDRDEHRTYYDALAKIKALDGIHQNFEGEPVSFNAISSVPCFEVWLLMHYQDVNAPLHRKEALSKLRSYLPDYEKGSIGNWVATQSHMTDAITRAEHRAEITNAHDGEEPYTNMFELVDKLLKLTSSV